MAIFSVSCADNLSYEYKMGSICSDSECVGDDRSAGGGIDYKDKDKDKEKDDDKDIDNYTDDMQWGKTYYQTLSLKHVAVKKDYIYGNVMIGSNNVDFSVTQANSANPEFTVLYSGNNFDDGLLYGTFDASLKLILDDEEYYTEQTITLKDFEHFSAYNVASFSDGAVEKEGFIGGFNVYSNSVVTKGDSSLVTGFNSIVSY